MIKFFMLFLHCMVILDSCFCDYDTFCSLEQMKHFAVESCEILFNKNQKRNAIDENTTKTSYKMFFKPYYPKGGYLIVHNFRNRPENLLLKRSQDNMLSKRSQNNDKIIYCCYHECDENFFC